MLKTKKWKKPVYVYVPEDFDPIKDLPSELQPYSDSARYFLHRIIWGAIQKKRNLDGFVLLKFDYLRQVIPSRLIVPLRKALEENGVISCDGHYIEGSKSFGYRLDSRFQSSRIVRVRIEDRATSEKIMAIRRADSKKLRLPVHRHLRDNLKRLEIDLPLALSLITNHPHYEVVKIPVESIAAREIQCSYCRYGRFHSEVTRCSRVVRPAFHFNGEPLCSIDVSCCQPLLLSLVMMSSRKYGDSFLSLIRFPQNSVNPYRNIDSLIETTIVPFIKEDKETIDPIHTLAITTLKSKEEKTQPIVFQDFETTTEMPPESHVNRQNLKPDENEFLKLCESGTLYQKLMDEMEWTHRGEVKRQFCRVLFAPNNRRFPLKTKFRELFPSVAALIRKLKRKDHRFLSYLLQNIESHLMIHCVCRRLMTELPQAPVITIHDAILTTKPFVESVKLIIQEEFSRLSLFPRLKDEDYGRKTATLSEARKSLPINQK